MSLPKTFQKNGESIFLLLSISWIVFLIALELVGSALDGLPKNAPPSVPRPPVETPLGCTMIEDIKVCDQVEEQRS